MKVSDFDSAAQVDHLIRARRISSTGIRKTSIRKTGIGKTGIIPVFVTSLTCSVKPAVAQRFPPSKPTVLAVPNFLQGRGGQDCERRVVWWGVGVVWG